MAACFKGLISKGSFQLLSRRYNELTGGDCPPVVGFHLTPPITKLTFKESYHMTMIDGAFKRDRTPIDYPVLGILCAATPYLPKKKSLHSSHAVAAFKYGDILFYFNAWGSRMLTKDATFWKFLAKTYKCTKVIPYKGPSLQYGNKYGLCAGYAANFVLEMLLRAKKGKSAIEALYPSAAFNNFIHRTLTTRGTCFGGKCIANGAFKQEMNKQLLRHRSEATPKNLKNMDIVELQAYGKRRFGMNARHKNPVALRLALKKALLNQLTTPQSKAKTPIRKGNGLNGLRVASLRVQAKRRGIRGYSKFTKEDDLRRYIRLGGGKATPPPKSTMVPRPKKVATPKRALNTMKAVNLRIYAKSKGITGYSKYTKIANLRNYIKSKNKPPVKKSPTMWKIVNPTIKKAAPVENNLTSMKLANLRGYAKSKGIKGYSKYTKIANLRTYIKSF